jgi:hypothetical protein
MQTYPIPHSLLHPRQDPADHPSIPLDPHTYQPHHTSARKLLLPQDSDMRNLFADQSVSFGMKR